MADIKQIIGSKCESIKAHMFSIEALCKAYDTDVDEGLTTEQAKENLKKYGPNKMKNMQKCTIVKRDGDYREIMTEDLVPGDIAFLEGGSRYGAEFINGDMRIVNIMEPVNIESYFLYNDCLNYLKEMTEDQTSEDPLETNNLIFHGTSIYSGRCLGLVFQTGDNMLLSDVCPEKLATPELPDSEDEETESRDDDDFDPSDLRKHMETIENICEMFSTDVEKGLTTEQAAINRKKSGKNIYNKYFEVFHYTLCKRDGEFKGVLTRRLTLGDIVSLKAPQVVPADIRVIEASADCTVDKCQLTGYGEPAAVSPAKTDDNPMQTDNIIFAMTRLMTGTCTGIVMNVGAKTVRGFMS